MTHWVSDLAAAPGFMTIESGGGGAGAAPKRLVDNVDLSITELLLIVIKR